MTSLERQKLIEKYQFDVFCGLSEIGFSNLKPMTEDGAPDFIIDFKNEIIGLELTELYVDDMPTGSIQRMYYSNRNKVLKIVERELLKKTDHKFDAYITFANSEIEGTEVKPLSKELTNLIQSLEGKIKNENPFEFINTDYHSNIERIKTFWFDGYMDINVMSTFFHWTPQIEIDLLYNAIITKEKKLNSYLTHCDKSWLLLIETGYFPSRFDNYEKLNSFNIESGFERIYLLRVLDRELFRLK